MARLCAGSFVVVLYVYFGIAALLMVAAGGADKMYHLATPGEACSTWTTLGSTVDLICQSAASGDAVGGGRRSRDPARTSDKAAPCAVSGLRWQRLVVGRALNITDSDKFGVWETIPGWGVSTEQRISLLRVRDVRAEDVGTYRCEMVCDGVERRVHHQAQLVLRQPEKNYAIRGIDLTPGFCSGSFWNGICDLDCTSERHLFDGFDCVDRLGACPQENICSIRFANGFCDDECSSAECGWDGGDCIETTLDFAEDTVVFFLARHQVASVVDTRTLSRTLTRLLQTIVRVMPREGSVKYTKQSPPQQLLHGTEGHTKYMNDHVLYIKLDITICKKNCFKKAEKAAHFIALALQKGWDPGISITAVTVLSKLSPDHACLLENNTMLKIDLSAVDRAPRQHSPLLSMPVQPWILGLAVTCGVTLIALVVTLTLVACKSRRRHYKHRRANSFDLYDSTSRIRAEKIPPGTDV